MTEAPTRTWDSDPSEGPSSGAAWVVGLDGEPTGPVALPSGLSITVGRDEGCGLRLSHPSVSRRHATLCFDGRGGFEVTDQGSRNGTFLGGQRVEGSARAAAGSEVRLGDRRFLLLVRARPERGLRDEPPIARDPKMAAVLAEAERVAATDVNVVLVGETGVGKEVLARFIHQRSGRAAGPFVGVNCGAIPEAIAASELFGHERGAFSGAVQRREGLFEAASGGTLLLDEITELNPSTQTMLLRALQEHLVTRLGGTKPIEVDVRVLSAAGTPLATCAREGRFREDLLYRLEVVKLEIPPLRERPLDIEPLATRFIERFARGRPVRLHEAAIRALVQHPWPGNVRQLENLIERTVALTDKEVIGASDLVDLHRQRVDKTAPWALDGRVADVEREALQEALEACGGNQSAAARRLGITRRALIYRMRKHGLHGAAS